jgi:hypothetical protein
MVDKKGDVDDVRFLVVGTDNGELLVGDTDYGELLVVDTDDGNRSVEQENQETGTMEQILVEREQKQMVHSTVWQDWVGNMGGLQHNFLH